MSNGEESDGAPQLRGAKCFTYDELKRSTNDFRGINEIGSGGYGKVNQLIFIYCGCLRGNPRELIIGLVPSRSTKECFPMEG